MSVQRTPRLHAKLPHYPNRIREYRLRLGLSQAELAKRIGKFRSQMGAWERGTQLPNVRTLLRLAKALNTLSESLYEGFYCELPRERPEASS